MTEKIEDIHIFKSDVKTEQDAEIIRPALDNNEKIKRWSVDLHDVDCVLRIISDSIKNADIIKLMHLLGYQCTEME